MISGTYSLYFLQVYWLDTLWECFCWVLAEQRVNKCLFMLQIFINRYPFNSTVAFISLPSVLQHSFPQNSWNQNPPRVVFQFFGIPMLFRVILSLKETRKQFNSIRIFKTILEASVYYLYLHIYVFIISRAAKMGRPSTPLWCQPAWPTPALRSETWRRTSQSHSTTLSPIK